MQLFRIHSVATALRALFGWVALIIGAYIVAAWVGSGLSANGDWRPPHSGGIPIYVETNGVHTGIIVPLVNGHADFRDLVRADQLAEARYAGTHILVGWGHGGVYRNARRWADVRSGDVLSAIWGSNDTVLHITHLSNPQALEPWRRRMMISPASYRRIATAIRVRFMRDSDGRTHATAGYGSNDLFYRAHGRYTVMTTCNSWTGATLRDAGLPMGRWTPLAGGVMRHIPAR